MNYYGSCLTIWFRDEAWRVDDVISVKGLTITHITEKTDRTLVKNFKVRIRYILRMRLEREKRYYLVYF